MQSRTNAIFLAAACVALVTGCSASSTRSDAVAGPARYENIWKNHVHALAGAYEMNR